MVLYQDALLLCASDHETQQYPDHFYPFHSLNFRSVAIRLVFLDMSSSSLVQQFSVRESLEGLIEGVLITGHTRNV